ncbi:MAG: hypothetical protein PHO10_00825 [Gemmiger sp.]|nr:hypothetical protein [Gemmiger sp.]
MKLPLLDLLATRLGLSILSDLRRYVGTTAFLKVLDGLNPEDFPLQEWNECLQYLLGENSVYPTCAAARAHLQAYRSRL